MFDLNLITEALIERDKEKVTRLVKNALDQKIPASDILKEGLIHGMDIVGEKMESGNIFIPEVLMSAKVMSAAMTILKPFLGEGEISSSGKLVIGTVKGDFHDIGKNLVAMMFESSGFEVWDLGVDVPPEKFVAKIKDEDATLLGLSALLTTTMPMMKQTIDAVIESGLRDRVRLLVGGAPVTQSFADEIGADGYAADAGSAVKLAKTFSSTVR